MTSALLIFNNYILGLTLGLILILYIFLIRIVKMRIEIYQVRVARSQLNHSK